MPKINQNYPGNRARYKKVYSFVKIEPSLVSFIDPITNTTKSLDFNSIQKEYNLYVIPGSSSYFPTSTSLFAEYDSACVFINNQTGTTFNFTSPFTSNPIVTLYLVSASVIVNPNITNIGATTTNCDVEFSGLYTGYLCWRAVYSPTYPAVVSPSYVVSAGKDVYNNENSKTISYTAFSSTPKMFSTTEDTGNNNTAGVYPTSSSTGLSSTTVTVSSQMSGSLNWIVFDSSYPT